MLLIILTLLAQSLWAHIEVVHVAPGASASSDLIYGRETAMKDGQEITRALRLSRVGDSFVAKDAMNIVLGQGEQLIGGVRMSPASVFDGPWQEIVYKTTAEGKIVRVRVSDGLEKLVRIYESDGQIRDRLLDGELVIGPVRTVLRMENSTSVFEREVLLIHRLEVVSTLAGILRNKDTFRLLEVNSYGAAFPTDLFAVRFERNERIVGVTSLIRNGPDNAYTWGYELYIESVNKKKLKNGQLVDRYSYRYVTFKRTDTPDEVRVRSGIRMIDRGTLSLPLERGERVVAVTTYSEGFNGATQQNQSVFYINGPRGFRIMKTGQDTEKTIVTTSTEIDGQSRISVGTYRRRYEIVDLAKCKKVVLFPQRSSISRIAGE